MKLVDKTFAEGEEVALTDIELTFNQEKDCLASNDQLLKVKLHGDQDKFFTIETSRWSFNSIEDLVETLKVIKNFKI